MSNEEQAPFRYEPIPRMSRETAVALVQAGEEDANGALYSIALYDEEDSFAADFCIAALESPSVFVRGAASGAIGEMAYFARRVFDFDVARVALKKCAIAYPELAGRVEDSFDDLDIAEKRLREVTP